MANSWPLCQKFDSLPTTATSTNDTPLQLTTVATVLANAQPTVLCCYAYNQIGLPQWFVGDVLLPYEMALCETPIGFWPVVAGYFVIADKYSWRPVDYRLVCSGNLKLRWYKYVNSHYFTFYGITIPTLIAFSEASAIKFLQLASYCTPFVVGIMIFGMIIIRRVLRKSDSSQLFIYHSILIVADVLLYLFSVTNRTIGQGIVAWPGCMASPYIAANFDGFAGTLSTIFLMSQYCFINIIQAILAADRACAVYLPVFYRARVSAKTAAIACGVTFLFNTLLTMAEVLRSYLVAAAMAYGTERFATIGLATTPVVIGLNGFRIGLLVFMLLMQVICCMATLFKIRRMKRTGAAAAGLAKANAISVVPCYLLVGTCGLNSIGTSVELTYDLTYALVSAGLVAYTPATNATLTSFNFVRFYAIPLCNSCGVWVHCIASRKYREEVAIALAPLFALCGRLCPGLRSRRVVAEGTSDQVSSTDSQGGSSSGVRSTGLAGSSRQMSSAAQASSVVDPGDRISSSAV